MYKGHCLKILNPVRDRKNEITKRHFRPFYSLRFKRRKYVVEDNDDDDDDDNDDDDDDDDESLTFN